MSEFSQPTFETRRPPQGQQIDIDSPEAYLQAMGDLVESHNKFGNSAVIMYERDIASIVIDEEAGNKLFAASKNAGNIVHATTNTTLTRFEELIDKVKTVYGVEDHDPTWVAICSMASRHGLESYQLKGVLDDISSPQVAKAMRASLDKLRWEALKDKAKVWGADAPQVEIMLNEVSSPQVAKAMRASLDKLRWEALKQKADIWGADHPSTQSLIETIPHDKVRQILAYMAKVPPREKQKPAGEDSSRNNSRSRNSLFDLGDLLGAMFGSGAFKDTINEQRQRAEGRSTQDTQPRSNNQPRPQVDPRVAELRGVQTGGSDKPYMTVLANIDHHRAKGMSDLEIYRLLARRFHPDSITDAAKKAETTAMFQALGAAYDSTQKKFRVE